MSFKHNLREWKLHTPCLHLVTQYESHAHNSYSTPAYRILALLQHIFVQFVKAEVCPIPLVSIWSNPSHPTAPHFTPRISQKLRPDLSNLEMSTFQADTTTVYARLLHTPLLRRAQHVKRQISPRRYRISLCNCFCDWGWSMINFWFYDRWLNWRKNCTRVLVSQWDLTLPLRPVSNLILEFRQLLVTLRRFPP